VHPGYGFLSENADFARACAEAGLVFIGPPADAIAAMGNKAEAKRRMARAGVPCVPGYQGSDQSDARLNDEGARIGFPLMVKAAAGGGGRGMRLVSKRGELAAALDRARAEAEGAFGSGELILEKAIAEARHVEVQVLADAHGNVVHLGERDCSVQRRHQKAIEEAPSAAVSPELRARMGAAAVAAARAIGYANAGTVEFLLAGDEAFYFLEMNTRLQVEHPVTELVTGLDLVELQIRIARGERLPLRQEEVRFDGHAIEARLYAEAPHNGFLPQSGRLVAWRPPAGVRVDHGLSEGQAVSPFYDPLLAKLIAHGPTREAARLRLVRALEDTVALGLATNRGFLIDCLDHTEFAGGKATTDFIPRHFAKPRQPRPDAAALALAAVLLFEASAKRHDHDPARTWSSSGAIPWPLRIETGGEPADLTVSVLGPRRYRVTGAAEATELELLGGSAEGVARFRIDGEERRAVHAFSENALHLKVGSLDLSARETLYEPRASAASRGAETEVRAPMNGRVVAVLVAEGQAIEKGQRLVVVEAMKMQHEMTAGASGTVARLAVKTGDQVAARQLLVELKPAG
jgi:geranyl-CoA carboxylase alpha subunit